MECGLVLALLVLGASLSDIVYCDETITDLKPNVKTHLRKPRSIISSSIESIRRIIAVIRFPGRLIKMFFKYILPIGMYVSHLVWTVLTFDVLYMTLSKCSRPLLLTSMFPILKLIFIRRC
ncbi:hypothetical protein GWI33_007886 [Rhynchophorus ferrugineus]|uniref:Uncharacterized protein n=1 Tax=Rhynchophorus ferrugineus TaxID=354439 RepID=A0A834MHZ2_RHYFE|nr:hypothetical protein GWI33_007886 [Rhynchophorus ferrugineus]